MAFSAIQRYAIFTVHGERCWLCRQAVSLSEMEVDHLVPVSLANSTGLHRVFVTLGLPSDFDLNSYENLMPAHRSCNGAKSCVVFEPTPLIQIGLQNAKAKAPAVRQLEQKALSDRQIDRAVNVVLRAAEADSLTKNQREQLSMLSVFHEGVRQKENQGQPFRLAPWLEVLQDGGVGGVVVMKGPSGMIGARPGGPNVHHSFDCPYCGPTAWNGARCISCGRFIDLD